MDNDALVEQLRSLVAETEQEAGPLALFMLLAPTVETDDAWNVIVSAHGFDRKSRGNAIREFTESLRNHVEQSQWSRIARTTILRTDDPFVKAMNAAFHTEHSTINLQSCNIFGIDIPKAVLFESKRVAA